MGEEDGDDDDAMELEDDEAQIISSTAKRSKFHEEAMSSLRSFASKTTKYSNNDSL